MKINWSDIANLETVISFMGSIISSFLVTYFFWIRPFKRWAIDIVFSDKLEKSKSIRNGETNLYRYRFKCVNMGKRDLTEVTIIARLKVKTDPNSSIINTECITVGDGCVIPLIYKMYSKKEQKDASKPENRKKYRPRIYVLSMNEVAYIEYSKTIYKKSIRDKARARTLTLGDIFEAYPEASITIYMFGNDCVTGTRRYYASKEYKKEDISPGKFKPFEGIDKHSCFAQMLKKQRKKLLIEEISKIIPDEEQSNLNISIQKDCGE